MVKSAYSSGHPAIGVGAGNTPVFISKSAKLSVAVNNVIASKTFDIHAHLAAPFSCLIITLFAIPAGVATGRQSVFKGVIIAIAMFFGFYAVSLSCMVLAKNSLMPPALGAWFANIGFLAAGLVLFHRQR
jgi:lipopolysaccharide export LptBFGC system permease protein LptF